MSLAGPAALAGWLAAQPRDTGLRVVGINGAQGSGKSTLASQLREMLGLQHGLKAVVLSICSAGSTS